MSLSWNYVLAGANCRTAREEQFEESEEFIKLFTTNSALTYKVGARTLSGNVPYRTYLFEQNWNFPLFTLKSRYLFEVANRSFMNFC